MCYSSVCVSSAFSKWWSPPPMCSGRRFLCVCPDVLKPLLQYLDQFVKDMYINTPKITWIHFLGFLRLQFLGFIITVTVSRTYIYICSYLIGIIIFISSFSSKLFLVWNTLLGGYFEIGRFTYFYNLIVYNSFRF